MNQATSATTPTTSNMSLAETQKALAHATALLRDAVMYVGSRAASGGLTGEIFKFLHATVPAEQMALPAVAVYTSATPAPGPTELECGNCTIDPAPESYENESAQGHVGAADTLAAAVPCAA